ncbi:hypothetical protein ACFIJ5_13195 [Haloimpatiens sp. FM7330]|uniref:hypothetical protein n=1 Tax=Haloimpatiens sp. FM7330 TaxID=3298610 RepID=UPI003631E11A
MFNSNYLFYIIAAFIVLFIILAIVKKAVKLVIFLIILLMGVSAYNIFIKGVSPKQELNSYKIDIQYGREIKDYTVKIKTSVDNIKKVLESEKIDAENIKVIKNENSNLHEYEKQIASLKYSSKLKFFHREYCKYLKKIVNGSDTTLEVANGSQNKNIKLAKEVIDNLTLSIDNLTEFSKEKIEN